MLLYSTKWLTWCETSADTAVDNWVKCTHACTGTHVYRKLTVRFFLPTVMDTETSPSHLQTKAYVRQLHVIDNQNLLFDLSCKLEPRDG